MLYDPKKEYRPPVPEKDEWRHVLNQAADLIEHLGWCRDDFTKNGRVCALGAIMLAGSRGASALPNVLRNHPGGDAADRFCIFLNYKSISEWNDAQSHRSEVVLALRSAAQQ